MSDLANFANAAKTRKNVERRRAEARARLASSLPGFREPDMTILADPSHEQWDAEFGYVTGTYLRQSLTPRDEKKETLAWLQAKGLPESALAKFESVAPGYFAVVAGGYCWVENHGGKLSAKAFERLSTELKSIKTKANATAETARPRIAASDKIAAATSFVIASIDEVSDAWWISGMKGVPGPIELAALVPSFYPRRVIAHYEPILSEIAEAVNTTDPDLKEGYSRYTKRDLCVLRDFYARVIKGCFAILGMKSAKRKPRASSTRTKTPSTLVEKLKYQKEDTTLKVASVDPTKVFGASQLWVFNTKYRKIGCYHAASDVGLSIKGQTIQNYDEEKSTQKTARKPHETLARVLAAGKVELRRIIADLGSTEGKLAGRIGEDTILLRVVF